METQLATIEPKDIQARDNSPAALMIEALAKGGNLEQLEKFMELQERYERNEARKAYHEAMAAFKADHPDIEKDKTVSFPVAGKTTSYTHASLGNVTTKINTALSAHGLSAGWKTEQEGGTIKVTCTITHRQGHSESTSLVAAPDTSGSKNSIQAVGSTISYLERYTILALTGLATHDMDDDGKLGEEPEYLNTDQQIEINDLIKEVKANETQFLAYMKSESVATIPAGQYKTALAALNAKKKAVEKKA
jgi:hypothetical protein